MSEPFIGEIKIFGYGNNSVPRGWLPCAGQTLNISTNQALFSILGITYGGDGVSTFKLPDLQGRVPLGISPDYALGRAGGEETHALTVAETPTHTHAVTAAGAAASKTGIDNNFWAATTSWSDSADATMAPGAIQQAGASMPHENLQPYLVLNYCIAMVGIYPTRP